ncbi:MAG: hypothetical protein HZC51_02105 [Nitrospirae bacterium]|nr:hypothetical protein [Nitrospirota bacterium]
MKKQVLTDLFERTVLNGNPVFDNHLVKEVCNKHGFVNPFDATKLDNLSRFPEVMIKEDYFIIHIGGGRHKFVKGINKAFHVFEDIPSENVYDWKYRKSILNELDTSESNILSVASNQRIIHDFLYEDIVANPKVYNSRRTKSTFTYNIGEEIVEADKVQIEIDLTMEYHGQVTIFEGKNKFPKNFAVYQLYHPFLYFTELRKEPQHQEVLSAIKLLNCCYVLRNKVGGNSVLRLFNYVFDNADDMASLRLQKAAQYNLVKR